MDNLETLNGNTGYTRHRMKTNKTKNTVNTENKMFYIQIAELY